MEDRTYEGEAYAVLTDAGELVFFRSEEKYEDGKIAHARDVLGNEYEGVVYSGIETKWWSRDDLPGWRGKNIKSARIADGQAIAPVSCAWWFHCQRQLSTCNLKGLDTGNVTDMGWMFHGCKSLQTPPDTSKWDTSNVMNMYNMFFDCDALVEPPDTSGWDTSNVEATGEMFWGCESLVEPPDTSGWDTSGIKDMHAMFAGCKSFAAIPELAHRIDANDPKIRGAFECCGNEEVAAELDILSMKTWLVEHKDAVLDVLHAIPEEQTAWYYDVETAKSILKCDYGRGVTGAEAKDIADEVAGYMGGHLWPEDGAEEDAFANAIKKVLSKPNVPTL